jgi:hypothetical protein
MTTRPTPNSPREYPEIMPHETFRLTDGYKELCAEYDLDPDRPWEDQTLPLDAAAEFFADYEATRRALAEWSPELVAAHYEGLTVANERDPHAPVWLDRHANIVVIQDPMGRCWTLTAASASPQLIAAAMARAQHRRHSVN